MNKKIILVFPCLYIILSSFARQGQITCRSEKNADGSYFIYADNKGFSDYTIKLTFTDLAGFNSSLDAGAPVIIGRGQSQIAKLTPVSGAPRYSFNYRYRYWPGTFFRKTPDTSFLYLMPSTAGNNLRISKVTSLAERIGQKNEDDFSAVGFRYKLGDTICAARGGIVYECRDDVQEGESLNQTFNTNRNLVAIEHKDGTLARYAVVAPVKLLVSPGEKVIPGQPLAVFNRESPKYHILFSVAYLDENKISYSLNLNKDYQVVYSNEVIAAEMSRKEKKKMGL